MNSNLEISETQFILLMLLSCAAVAFLICLATGIFVFSSAQPSAATNTENFVTICSQNEASRTAIYEGGCEFLGVKGDTIIAPDFYTAIGIAYQLGIISAPEPSAPTSTCYGMDNLQTACNSGEASVTPYPHFSEPTKGWSVGNVKMPTTTIETYTFMLPENICDAKGNCFEINTTSTPDAWVWTCPVYSQKTGYEIATTSYIQEMGQGVPPGCTSASAQNPIQ
jgi:hypothetical protein